MLCKPFDTYIAECADQIREHRPDEAIIHANSPYEFRPDHPEKPRNGALLIHGLFDSPFSLRDIAEQLKQAGILSRSVLLPGHGTKPTNLLNVKYADWVDTVRYGVESLRQEVDNIFLVGYSTGGTLSINHALHDNLIKGIILLAPALKILPPVSTIVKWPILANFFAREDKWLCQEEEIDYIKYESIPFSPILELGKLIESIKKTKHPLTCPTLMAMSLDDETVSAFAALRYFNMHANGDSRSIIYTNKHKDHQDKRVEIRGSAYPKLHIKQMSHIAIPFSPNNPHYGQQGDYAHHSNPDAKHTIYGAYNRLQTKIYDQMYRAGVLKTRRATLTYNPDFDYMASEIIEFINGSPPARG